jgi:hypothetical protein
MLWVPICVSLPGVIIIGAGQPACFVFGYRFRRLGVAGRITIDDVAKHAAVEDSAHRQTHRRLSLVQKSASGSRTHAQIVPNMSTSSNDLRGYSSHNQADQARP